MSDVLTLKQAAEFLQMDDETLRRKVVAGEIPGKKLGNWRFVKEDLVTYIRSGYSSPALQGEENPCSAKSKAQVSSTLASQTQAEKDYANLLAPKTKNSPRSTRIRSRRSFGEHTDLGKLEGRGRKL